MLAQPVDSAGNIYSKTVAKRDVVLLTTSNEKSIYYTAKYIMSRIQEAHKKKIYKIRAVITYDQCDRGIVIVC